jgi:hypothetical protein
VRERRWTVESALVDDLAEAFRRWSDIEAVTSPSPLYQALGHVVADDAELLALAAETRPGQPGPNMLFGAVHAVLHEERGHPLARYYPTVGGTRAPDGELAGVFREFCLEYRERLTEILHTRMVQTNEVRRSAVLMPAFAAVSEDGGGPLALFEIGPSAGLNLNFDRYAYDYAGRRIGGESPVWLESDPRGNPPNVAIPTVASRMGVDLNPLYPENAEDMAWLCALLWPEHLDRLALMNAAIDISRSHPPELVEGDFREALPARIRATPAGQVVCLFASFVLNQFSPELLADLRSMLLELSKERELYFVVMGFTEFVAGGHAYKGDTLTWVLRVKDGRGERWLSSLANPHGRWLELQPAAKWEPWDVGATAGGR